MESVMSVERVSTEQVYFRKGSNPSAFPDRVANLRPVVRSKSRHQPTYLGRKNDDAHVEWVRPVAE